MIKLNIGCGLDIMDDYVNIDIKPLKGVDKVMDIQKVPWDCNSDIVKDIKAYNVLEHMEDYTKVLKEAYRVLEPKGTIEIIVPHFSSVSAYTDPTHKKFFGYNTFDYYLIGNEFNYYFDFGFKKIYKKIEFYKGIHIYNHLVEFIVNSFNNLTKKSIYEYTLLRNIFPARQLKITLIK